MTTTDDYIATFPDDGLTLSALLSVLHGLPTERIEAPSVEPPPYIVPTRVSVLAGTGRAKPGRGDSDVAERRDKRQPVG